MVSPGEEELLWAQKKTRAVENKTRWGPVSILETPQSTPEFCWRVVWALDVDVRAERAE